MTKRDTGFAKLSLTQKNFTCKKACITYVFFSCDKYLII